ncbi:MAG: hypothetical protein J6B68_06355 [Lachnospiraceae bacterium]|nr:hypothetical protein [Lachnospiraceae bacterium]
MFRIKTVNCERRLKNVRISFKTGKIGEKVVGAYQKIEDGVVGAYKKVEDAFVDTFLEKVEDEKTEEKKQEEA